MSIYNYITLDPSGSIYTEPRGINNAGQIVGTYFDSSSSHSFLYGSGTYASLDLSSSGATQAYGINDASQIVGSYFDGSSTHAFLYAGGIITNIDGPVPSSFTPVATGINNAGQIIVNEFPLGCFL